MSFEQQLFGAWRAVGLTASARPDGCLIFACPKCPAQLDAAEGVALCSSCGWGAEGEPWSIASAAAKARPATADTVDELLNRTAFSAGVVPPAPEPLFRLGAHTIATRENLMVVQAKMKAGKSAAVGAMLAATMGARGDCLWFSASNATGMAVVHMDTEQSAYDHHALVVRSLRRAGRCEPPDWLRSHHVKGYSVRQMREMVSRALERGAEAFGGVHCCVIDGIADLCADVNDSAEANALVADMEALAMQYRTLIVAVLHENHGSETGKTRGHLGSQLARKAETNLRLEKDGEGTTVMYADTSRSVHIPREKGFRFRWDDEAKMHVSVEPERSATERMQEIAEECCGEQTSYTELTKAIQERQECSIPTAKRLIASMVEKGIIVKKNARYEMA